MRNHAVSKHDHRRLLAVAALSLIACSRDVATGRRCMMGQTACGANAGRAGGGFDNLDGSMGAAGRGAIGTSINQLEVHVEDIRKMTIEIITVKCAGDCADVQAVASGGNPPYKLAWNDGSSAAKRHVCPSASTHYSVSATDTEIKTSEFGYAAHTVTAKVNARVLDCGDGGVPSPGSLCLKNPSFEGTAEAIAGFSSGFDAAPWNACEYANPDYPDSTPDIVGTSSLGATLAATQGATYLHAGWDPTGPLHEYVTQQVCAPMLAGHSYSFTIDLASKSGFGVAQLALYGSAKDCSREQLLWTSAPLGTSWTNVCVTLTPTKDVDYLTFEPTSPDKSMIAFLLADNIVPVVSCSL